MHPRSLVARALGLIRDATLFVLTLIGWFGLAAAPCVLWALALGAPESSSGADATVPLFGLLWLCCALMLSPRAIEALRRLGRARRLDDVPAPAEPPWLSPTRRAWLHETRWLLASLERAREQEAMQEVWEYVARARRLRRSSARMTGRSTAGHRPMRR